MGSFNLKLKILWILRTVKRYQRLIFITILISINISTIVSYSVMYENLGKVLQIEKNFYERINWELVNESCKTDDKSQARTATSPSILIADTDGRLGNHMFSYAALYGISKNHSHHKVMLSPRMSTFLLRYFTLSACPIMYTDFVNTHWVRMYLFGDINIWAKGLENIGVGDDVKFVGYPESWRYFDEYRSEIRREFKFRDNILSKAKAYLHEAIPLSKDSSKLIVIGVHVRRRDYIDRSLFLHMDMPTREFYEGAMKYFANKFIGDNKVVFLIVSDDIPWCETEFSYLIDELEIKFLNGASTDDGGIDMAVLTLCDHVIFGIGTFGWWGGYLSGGEVAFCSDCVLPTTSLMNEIKDYGNFVLGDWKGFNRKGEPSSELAKWVEVVEE